MIIELIHIESETQVKLANDFNLDKEYIGEYEIRPELHVVMSVKDGLLVAAPTGQSPKELYAEKEDFFFEKTEDVQVEFTRNDKKEVDGFVLHQGGQTVKCKKIK